MLQRSNLLRCNIRQDGVGGQRHAPADLPQIKSSRAHFTERFVGPKAGLDGCEKSRPANGDTIPEPPSP